MISLEDMRKVHGRRQDEERDREASETYCLVGFCFWMALSQRRKVVDEKGRKGRKNNIIFTAYIFI